MESILVNFTKYVVILKGYFTQMSHKCVLHFKIKWKKFSYFKFLDPFFGPIYRVRWKYNPLQYRFLCIIVCIKVLSILTIDMSKGSWCIGNYKNFLQRWQKQNHLLQHGLHIAVLVISLGLFGVPRLPKKIFWSFGWSQDPHR